MRRGGRVVECSGLENRRAVTPFRGFESLPLRHHTPGATIPSRIRLRCAARPHAHGLLRNDARSPGPLPAQARTPAVRRPCAKGAPCRPGDEGTGRGIEMQVRWPCAKGAPCRPGDEGTGRGIEMQVRRPCAKGAPCRSGPIARRERNRVYCPAVLSRPSGPCRWLGRGRISCLLSF